MNDKFNEGCDKNSEGTSCRWELDKLKFEVGNLELSRDGLQFKGVPGSVKNQGVGVKYEYTADLGPKVKVKNNADHAREDEQENLDSLRYEAEVARATISWDQGQKNKAVREATLRPDEYRDIHGEDPFTGEAVS